jgi:hypothetical protein
MSDDIIIVERPREARRIVVTVPGRFSFADVRDARGERRVFGCHAVNPSIREIVIASPVTAKMDARVIAYIDHLGKLDGMVTCVLQRGFVMGVNVKQNERRKLAAKIEWLQQHKNSEVREQRADSRFVPKDPYSRMILADGHLASFSMCRFPEPPSPRTPFRRSARFWPSARLRAASCATLMRALPFDSSSGKAATP